MTPETVAQAFQVTEETARLACAAVDRKNEYAAAVAFAAIVGAAVVPHDLDVAVVSPRGGAFVFDLSEAGGGIEWFPRGEWERRQEWVKDHPYREVSLGEPPAGTSWRPYPATDPGACGDAVRTFEIKVGAQGHVKSALWDDTIKHWREKRDGFEGPDCPFIRGVTHWRRVRVVFLSLTPDGRFVELFQGNGRFMMQHKTPSGWSVHPACPSLSHPGMRAYARCEGLKETTIAGLFDEA